MIILTAEDATLVRGETEPGHALDPRPLADGTFALPEVVLADPAHERHYEFLTTLPRREVGDEEWVAEEA